MGPTERTGGGAGSHLLWPEAAPSRGHGGWDGRKQGLGGTGGGWAARLISETRTGRRQARAGGRASHRACGPASAGGTWGEGRGGVLKGVLRLLSKAKQTRLRAWRTFPEPANGGPLRFCSAEHEFPTDLMETDRQTPPSRRPHFGAGMLPKLLSRLFAQPSYPVLIALAHTPFQESLVLASSSSEHQMANVP